MNKTRQLDTTNLKEHSKQHKMIDFIQQLKLRNETLFYYGLLCLALSVIFLTLTKFTNTQVYNVNAWYKPFKFAFSTFLFAWAMAWYCYYLPNFNINLFNWSVIILLGFEIFYIAFQANKGQLSHYNLSTPLYCVFCCLWTIGLTYTLSSRPRKTFNQIKKKQIEMTDKR